MKIKQIVLSLLGVLIMSCAAFKTTSDKMNKIELGMTKNETTKILGKGQPVLATTTPDGKIEKYSYENYDGTGVRQPDYILIFKNDRLIEWYTDEKMKDRRKKHIR